MTIREQIISNYETHGLQFVVQWSKKRRINPDTVIYVLTGRYSRALKG